MINKILFTGFLSFLFLFQACDNKKEPETDLSLSPSGQATSTPAVVADTNNTIQNLPANAFDTGRNVITPQANTSTQPATTAPGMNPPHGQPNHRCDIAVGAPLNSPAANPAVQTTTTSTPAITPTVKTADASPAIVQAAPAPAVKTAPGMNPPHGEPNHRCDIAVGAPLNSPATKPAATTVSPAATDAPATITPPVQIMPSKKDSSKK